ncbi:CbtB-domain containing protein [Oricola cellulosilytica]|uniref:CbtB-domain containing protein n=2 Tax=Oricola cellulosilytica TaxID=1429082 RepID=A0A4R0PF59_9HYPH|nr:CbtB-domain containing protein [Oricola cellulosilytica]
MSNTEVVMLATNTQSVSWPISATARLYTAMFAGSLGVFLFYFAAFAQSDLLHNGTHDTRHAIVAPCH